MIIVTRLDVTEEQIDAYNEMNGVEIVRGPTGRGSYILKPTDAKNALVSLELANSYHESDLTEWAAPNIQGGGYLTASQPAQRATMRLPN